MIRIRSAALATLGAVLALPPGSLAAQAGDARPTVAVLYFDNNSIGRDAADYAGVGRGIADLLITELAGNANIRLVERERIQALIQEQNLTAVGTIDPETAVRIGKILGVRHMIMGGFMNTGRGQMVLTARTVDVETSQIGNPQRVQQSGDDVLALVSQLSARLAASLNLPPVERRTGDAGHGGHHGAPPAARQVAGAAPAPGSAMPAKLDMRTALLYSKALEAQDAGDRAKAVELYDQVLDRFPTLESARVNRDRLRTSDN
jgi:TolB-like protein